MKIYFACSITGGRDYEGVYQSIVAALLAGGHEVPTAHLASPDVVALEEVVEPEEVYRRDINWIESSDALIAEVSTPSHGVGFEIAYALAHGKTVLCCYQAGTPVSKMISGNTHSQLQRFVYRDPVEAASGVREFLDTLQDKVH